MTRALLIAMALSVSVPVPAQLPSPTPEVAAKVNREDRYPPRNVTFPNGVRGIADPIYWNRVGYRPVLLDLYLPPVSVKRPATVFPLVVFIHGGGWLIDDKHRTTRHQPQLYRETLGADTRCQPEGARGHVQVHRSNVRQRLQ